MTAVPAVPAVPEARDPEKAAVSGTESEYDRLLRQGGQEAIRARVVNDAAFRRFLIDGVSREPDLDRRGMLLAVLAAARHEDIRQQALVWMNAGSPELRREGFRLLQSYDPGNPEVQQAVLLAMRQETSPDVLREAVRTLPADVAAAENAETVTARLRALTTHTDPGVRNEALTQLVRWEPDAAVLQGALLNGLRDSAEEVRQASLMALETSGQRSDALKQGLLAMAQNADEGFSARSEALARLNAYRLNDDERRRFRAAREAVSLQYQSHETAR